MNVLVSGGCGYIGSSLVKQLLCEGNNVWVLDDLSNGSLDRLDICTQNARQAPLFVNIDLCDRSAVDDFFLSSVSFDVVYHLAGKRSVVESVINPHSYFYTNVVGSVNLIHAAFSAGIKQFIFSSSASIYGSNSRQPVDEDIEPNPESPYAMTKTVIENFLRQMSVSQLYSPVAIGILRYFNPIGAQCDGTLGDIMKSHDPNLCSVLIDNLLSGQASIPVYGNDYRTPDGTCVRDFIHVLDLVKGHVQASNFLNDHPGTHVWNLGTGHGTTVLDFISAFERVSGTSFKRIIKERRVGDIAVSTASTIKAYEQLQWSPEYTIEEMIDHALKSRMQA